MRIIRGHENLLWARTRWPKRSASRIVFLHYCGVFLHYCGVGPTEALAKTLRAALDKTKHEPPPAP